MEILFIPKDIQTEDLLNIHINDIVSQDLNKIKLILNNISLSYTIKSIDISKSADFIVFKPYFSDLTTLDSLNQELYAKFGNLISQIQELTSHLYLDKYASYCLGLHNLQQEHTS